MYTFNKQCLLLVSFFKFRSLMLEYTLASTWFHMVIQYWISLHIYQIARNCKTAFVSEFPFKHRFGKVRDLRWNFKKSFISFHNELQRCNLGDCQCKNFNRTCRPVTVIQRKSLFRHNLFKFVSCFINIPLNEFSVSFFVS